MKPPEWQPLFDRILAFAAAPRFERELLRARDFYFTQTGEVFDDDRSFEARMTAFLDWFVFDRPLAPFGEPPCRIYARETGAPEAVELRTMARTVHGVFAVRRVRPSRLRLRELVAGTDCEVAPAAPLEGLRRGDLFEARLVPWRGALTCSAAFVFHPSHLRRAVVREARRMRREEPASTGQDLVWTLSRMALRCEHYRAMSRDALYDFARPPRRVPPGPMRSWNGPWAPSSRDTQKAAHPLLRTNGTPQWRTTG